MTNQGGAPDQPKLPEKLAERYEFVDTIYPVGYDHSSVSTCVLRVRLKPGQPAGAAADAALKIYSRHPQDGYNKFEWDRVAKNQFSEREASGAFYGFSLPWEIDISEPDKVRYSLSEYIPYSLDDAFDPLRHKPGSTDELERMVKRLLCHMAAALNQIHGRNVIHNDIRPANIRCKDKENGLFCLIDFDLAIVLTKDPASDQATRPSKDIADLGKLLYYAWHGHDPDPQTGADDVTLPLWLRELRKRIRASEYPDGRTLWNDLAHIISDDPEWLLNDRIWADLNTDFDHAIMVHQRSDYFRVGRGALTALSASSSGDYVALATATGWWVRNTEDIRSKLYSPHVTPPRALAWHPDRTDLAVGFGNGRVEMWRLPDPKKSQRQADEQDKNATAGAERPQRVIPSHPEAVQALAWLSGDLLAVGGDKGGIYIWHIGDLNAVNGHAVQVMPLRLHHSAITSLAYNAQQTLLASAAAGEPFCRLWKLKDPQNNSLEFSPLRKVVTGHEIGRLLWLDSDLLLTAGVDHALRAWRVSKEDKNGEGCELVETVGAAHGRRIVDAVYDDSDGKRTLITSGLDGMVRFWELVRGADGSSVGLREGPTVIPEHSFHFPTMLTIVKRSKRRILLTGSRDLPGVRQYRFYPDQLQEVEDLRTLRIFDSPITTLEWIQPDRNRMRYELLMGDVRGTLRLWGLHMGLDPALDPSQKQIDWPLGVHVSDLGRLQTAGHLESVHARQISRNLEGKLLISTRDGHLHLFDPMSGRSFILWHPQVRPTGVVAWHPTAPDTFYFSTAKGGVYVARLNRAKDPITISQIDQGNGMPVTGLAVSRDGQYLAFVSRSRVMTILSLTNGQAGKRIESKVVDEIAEVAAAPLQAVIWIASESGDLFAVADGRDHIWFASVENGVIGREKLDSPVTRIISLPERKAWALITCHADDSFGYWQYDDDKKLQRVDRRHLHNDHISDMKISPDDRWVASSSHDGSIVIVATGGRA